MFRRYFGAEMGIPVGLLGILVPAAGLAVAVAAVIVPLGDAGAPVHPPSIEARASVPSMARRESRAGM
jgi:hypothetical protein